MGRGRPPLPVGAYGSISFLDLGEKRVRARTRFRDYDGRVRYVAAVGASRSGAERRLKVALAERREVSAGGGDFTADTRVSDLAERWLERIDADPKKARSTKRRYRDIVEQFVDPGLGALRLREVNAQALDRMLTAVLQHHGAANARAVRSVTVGMCKLAVSYGAMGAVPTPTVALGSARKVVRSLTRVEADELLEKLAGDETIGHLDLVDVVTFMLATGLRIGEVCALRVEQVDLGAGTVEVNATVTRYGLEERPKSKSGWRVIAVPPRIVELLRRRIADPDLATGLVMFPSPLGRVRDVGNTTADLRRALDAAGFEWVTSHVFRKSVATWLDQAGLSARAIADHLGHAQPSMTQDVYMGRRVATSEAAERL